MTIKEREAELRHLMKMTTGIRLYNKELDPAMGLGIPDCKLQIYCFRKNMYASNFELLSFVCTVIGVLPQKISGSIELMNDMRSRNIYRLISYTTLTRPYFLSQYQTSKIGRRSVSQQMVWIRQGLVMVHQILIYLK
jgi:hypothetical protein